MNKLTEWWINYQRLEGVDLERINQFCPRVEKYEDNERWSKAVADLESVIPLGNTLNNHQLYIEESATGFIDYLFDKYIDDNTLLITSVVEHDAVKAATKRLGRETSDHVIVHYFNGINVLNISQVKEALMKKKYTKAFVYIIGTQITTGEQTPQKFYEKLKDYLNSQGIESTFVIDDVHGLFLVPRDYSLFDYVISTAHALIRRWDMGLMWSKTDEEYGKKYYNWLETYTELVKQMLQLQVKLSHFSYVMKEEFVEYINKPYIELIPDSAPHIFSLKIYCPPRYLYTMDVWEEFAKYEVRLETQNFEEDDIFYIRMRGSQYITFPEMATEAVGLARKMLDKVVLLKGEEEL